MYVATKGRLYERVTHVDCKESSSRQLFYAGAITKFVLNFHDKDHVGVKNTPNKIHVQYVGKGLGEVKKDQEQQNEPQIFLHCLSSPFYLVGWEFIGTLTETPSYMKYKIVAVRYPTKSQIFKVIKEINAEIIAQFIQDKITAVYGAPCCVITDIESNCLSKPFIYLSETY
ncbi:uncharacterized protein EV154DRAFT_488971 [Mucor mucedo]|uniref:uncharacterized protein n=1 Tax=Mucor mucedo TaxID=29922 RepID=UPI00221FB362|nr:uncharacterized protein EV154DRAFT_488971 [Mucor mucedo]KAI7864084.1 hypothetical protein EV154DRAFT_488971 [Mucor mucedo]